MKFDSIADLASHGFQGFITVAALQHSGCGGVPDQPGVYLVIWPHSVRPLFLTNSIGGHFKDRNPTVPIRVLESQWLDGARVIYIGKAGSATGDATLRRRLRSYMMFGSGKPVGHWGGRYIWQIADAQSLQPCWKPTTGHEAPALESRLIQGFAARYGKRPFANLRD